ncbi:uncharacterized protein LOC143436817 [Arvicanthis niloticus]
MICGILREARPSRGRRSQSRSARRRLGNLREGSKTRGLLSNLFPRSVLKGDGRELEAAVSAATSVTSLCSFVLVVVEWECACPTSAQRQKQGLYSWVQDKEVTSSWSSFPRKTRLSQKGTPGPEPHNYSGLTRYPPGELTRGVVGPSWYNCPLRLRLFYFVRGEADSVKEVRGPDPLLCFL